MSLLNEDASIERKLMIDSTLVEDYRADDMICSECALEVGESSTFVPNVETSDDKRNYDPSLVGAAEDHLLNGSDMTTIIVHTAQSRGKADDSRKYRKSRNVSSTDRVLINAYKEIRNIGKSISISQNIIDRANLFFKQFHDGNKLKSRSHKAIAAACLYIACRHEGAFRTFKEICAVSNVSKCRIARSFFMLNEVLETSINSITTGDFMSRFCSNLNLSSSVQRAATHIAEKAEELDILAGKSPISVAAAALYFTSQTFAEEKSLKEIVEVTGVAESTIRQSYKLMCTRVKELLPSDFKWHASN
ncbi:transcription initiation factor IIB-like isoform X1 [Leptotrombidium deliense]|uniref:Transcription initiation factor IIB n=1 Tax=Leptotrombidium deliense TaxID=299467 RepID=A0A443RYC1_9ACAR|nr:transcription initiation factor IIB-like isoform X1 [Leptotrombidium deliense]